ncbi:MAG: RNA polymerase, sigma-24 subunit, ECF subfamily [Parcubacteria group bacterium GW2011_GWA1_47_11]|nr:MAG: RNA polymerase, sigma-24 subunit, ECF subfamily [Parcubacteria group bacterium GW2011_GWA1_47_11]
MMEGEKNLVEKARKGNSEAFGILYDYYLPKIYRFVLFKVSHKQQAEDITQHAFMKAWENMGGYKPQGHPFGSWLYRIARNSVIDYYRKNEFSVDIEAVSPEALGIDNSLIAKLEVKLEWEKILNAIGGLTEVEQDVLIMRFVEDLPHGISQEVLEQLFYTEANPCRSVSSV